MTKEELLREGVLAKFTRYVQIHTQSSEEGDVVPSTPCQWDLARMLRDELLTLGLSDVRMDEHAIVTATLPGNVAGAPVVGFLAHIDTVPGVPGEGVKPILHRAYAGGELELPGGPVLRPNDHPALAKVVGHDLVTSDGSTLLGADDKAGVSEIMEALCRLLQEPKRPRCTVRAAFTSDEETGKGIEFLNVEEFGAYCAYTLDGGELGEIEGENFNALNLEVAVRGVSAHTGTARGVMVNAVHLAAELLHLIPAGMRPETTDGYLGFLHPNSIEGNVEEVRMVILVRDFTDEGLESKYRILEELLAGLELRHPGARTEVRLIRGYQNMKEKLDQDSRVMGLALQASQEAGIQPLQRAIRGGTDGARLSFAGLPTPNLFDGGMNFHSRTEWISVQWMEKAVEVVLNLVSLWAREKV